MRKVNATCTYLHELSFLKALLFYATLGNQSIMHLAFM